jgi:hypothetical protein
MSARVQFTIDERRRLSDEKLLASLREYDAELYEKTRAATSLGLTHWAWYGPGHFSDTDTSELALWLARHETTDQAVPRN